MPAATPSRTRPAQTTADTWPWSCLGCEATLYHDALYCAECRARERQRVTVTSGSSTTFGRWIRDQSYPSFVSAVSVVASLEVGLTALWLQLLLTGTVALPAVGV